MSWGFYYQIICWGTSRCGAPDWAYRRSEVPQTERTIAFMCPWLSVPLRCAPYWAYQRFDLPRLTIPSVRYALDWTYHYVVVSHIERTNALHYPRLSVPFLCYTLDWAYHCVAVLHVERVISLSPQTAHQIFMAQIEHTIKLCSLLSIQLSYTPDLAY